MPRDLLPACPCCRRDPAAGLLPAKPGYWLVLRKRVSNLMPPADHLFFRDLVFLIYLLPARIHAFDGHESLQLVHCLFYIDIYYFVLSVLSLNHNCNPQVTD